jgi:ERCC4-type nuclease
MQADDDDGLIYAYEHPEMFPAAAAAMLPESRASAVLPAAVAAEKDFCIFIARGENSLLAAARKLCVPPKYDFDVRMADMDVADIIVARVLRSPPSPAATTASSSSSAAAAPAPEGHIRIDGTPARPAAYPGATYAYLFGLERKTRSDLAASITSGSSSSARGANVPTFARYSDQKARMRAFAAATGACMGVVVERYFVRADTGGGGGSAGYFAPRYGGAGPKKGGYGGISEDGLDTALLHTAVRDDLLVFHTANTPNTARLAAKLAKYARQVDLRRGDARVQAPDAVGIAVRKRENFDAGAYTRAVLTAVPGMSEVRVRAVMSRYPSVARLVHAYDACVTRRAAEQLLKDVLITGGTRTAKGNYYKLGKAASKRIYELLCDPDGDDDADADDADSSDDDNNN